MTQERLLVEVIGVIDGDRVKPVDMRRAENTVPASGQRLAESDSDRLSSLAKFSGFEVFDPDRSEADSGGGVCRPFPPFDPEESAGGFVSFVLDVSLQPATARLVGVTARSRRVRPSGKRLLLAEDAGKARRCGCRTCCRRTRHTQYGTRQESHAGRLHAYLMPAVTDGQTPYAEKESLPPRQFASAFLCHTKLAIPQPGRGSWSSLARSGAGSARFRARVASLSRGI